MHSTSTSIGLLLARVPLGLYFAIAGWNKLVGIGPGSFADAQLANAVQFMPEAIARPWLFSLPFVELIVGLLVLVGLGVRAAGLVMALLLISFLVAATPIAPNIARIWTTEGAAKPFESNVIYLGVALLLLFAGGGRFGLDRLLVRRHHRRKKIVQKDGSVVTVKT